MLNTFVGINSVFEVVFKASNRLLLLPYCLTFAVFYYKVKFAYISVRKILMFINCYSDNTKKLN